MDTDQAKSKKFLIPFILWDDYSFSLLSKLSKSKCKITF